MKIKVIKFYESIKEFIKRNYKLLVIYIVLLCLFTIPLDYEIYTPGGLINLEKRLDVIGYHEKGNFNLTYVGAKKGIIPLLLLSYIMPNWDIVSVDEMRIGEEDYAEIMKRGQIDLNSINQNAILVAFKNANHEYKINKYDIAVYYVFEEADTDLEVGDIITHINDKKVKDLEDLKNKINEYEVEDKVYFKVLRDNVVKECYGKIYKENGEKLIGLYLKSMIELETMPEVKFNYNKNENGSSGGLMTALQIYNTLIDEDITKGDTISGTGTIELDGTVGEIAGVKYKLIGAVKKGADVFIVPAGNYEEAMDIKREKDYEIEIIKADKFENVIEKLKNR